MVEPYLEGRYGAQNEGEGGDDDEPNGDDGDHLGTRFHQHSPDFTRFHQIARGMQSFSLKLVLYR